jgi:cytochrome d ubiquinol oxidase subunit I
LAAWALWVRWRRRELAGSRWFLRFAALAGVGAVMALEAGWIVTEVGRQPWVVYRILRTADAVTHAEGVRLSLAAIVVLYTSLGIATLLALRAMTRRWTVEDAADDDAGGVPYGPPETGRERPTGGPTR